MHSKRFRDYRTTNDGVMVADVGFKRQLRILDKELDVVWNGSKWEIWRFPGQKGKVKKISDPRAIHVMTVQTQKRTFRDLGADILLKLRAGDLHKYSTKQIMDYLDAIDDNIQRAKRKDFEGWFDDRKAEVAWYTRGLRVSIPKRFMQGSYVLKGPKKSIKVRRVLANE
jgi:hypothetical protein